LLRRRIDIGYLGSGRWISFIDGITLMHFMYLDENNPRNEIHSMALFFPLLLGFTAVGQVEHA